MTSGVIYIIPKAFGFMARWQELSRTDRYRTEEGSLCGMLATQDSPARIKALPPRFSGLERGKAPADAIIAHASAHKHDLPAWKRLEHHARAAYRALLPGRRLEPI